MTLIKIAILCLVILFSNVSNGILDDSVIKKQDEMVCLIKNIYHESRGEPLKGQRYVAQVTLNRVATKNYPETICKVVYQKNQFSWTKKEKRISGSELNDAYNIALLSMTNGYADKMIDKKNALFYHNLHVHPMWANKMKVVDKIGNHIFYAKN